MRKLLPLFILFVMASCASIDCPINSTVYIRSALRGDVVTLKDTLTIALYRTAGDTTLFNRGINTTTFDLPVTYSDATDTWVLDMKDEQGIVRRDTIHLTKTNQSHFESVDCPPTFFHTIIGVTHTKNTIDSIVINNQNVNYDNTKDHLYIYFHPRS